MRIEPAVAHKQHETAINLHSSLNHPQESDNHNESTVDQRSPLNHPQDADNHNESTANQRSQLDHPQESAVPHKSYESTINLRPPINYSRKFPELVTSHESTVGLPSPRHSESIIPRKLSTSIDTNDPTETTDQKPTQVIQLPFQIAVSKAHRHVLPRAAFFDRRKRGKFKNATVILAHVKKAAIEQNLIIACKVDGHQTNSFKIQVMKMNGWIHANHPECTHDNVLILCYDTPGRIGSRVSLVYTNPDNESQHLETESEHPLYVPHNNNNNQNIERSRSTVMVCTTVYNTPPYFSEWLHYQRALGVDMVYINAQQSFLESKEFNDTFFQGLLADGFVQLKVWQEYLNTREVFYHSQLLYYQNCLYRFQGIHDYAVMVDTDDFVIVRSNTTLQHCLDNLFVKNWGSTRLRWVRYYEPRCGLNFTGRIVTSHDDGNLTQYMNFSSASREKNFKSIHKLSTTLEVEVHEVGELLPGYRWTIAPDNIIYAAHIKKLKLDKDQWKKECGNDVVNLTTSSSGSMTKPQALT